MKNKRIMALLTIMTVVFSITYLTSAASVADLREETQYCLSLPYDADFVAKNGDTVGTTWLGGKQGNNLINGLNGNSGNFHEGNISANNVKFKFPVDGLSGGFCDSIVRFQEDENPINIVGSKRPSKALYFAYMSNGSATFLPIEVKYTDGTTENLKVLMPGFPWSSPSAYPGYLNKFHFDYNCRISVNGIIQPNPVASFDSGISVSYINVSENKIIESVILKTCYTNSVVFAISEAATSNAELLKIVNSDISTMTAEQLKYAKCCVDELVLRGGNELDYKNVVNAYQQLKCSEIVYTDLTNYLDSDIMVAEGDKKPDNYQGKDNDLLYDANRVPNNGMLTMVAPTDTNYVDPLTGTTFKLSGSYKGVGNDSVLVSKTNLNGVTIPIADVAKKYKNLNFVFDSDFGNQAVYNSIDISINYADGTSKADTSYTFYCAGYYLPSKYAHTKDFYGRMTYSTDKSAFILSPNILTLDGTGFYPSTVSGEIENKEVKSVTFMPRVDQDYHLVAISAIPYTTNELLEKTVTFFDLLLADETGLSEINMPIVEEGAKAAIELYEVRKFNLITKEDYDYSVKMLAAVEKRKELGNNILKLIPSVSVQNGVVTATASMVNTTKLDKSYILVVGAYGSDNKLLNVSMTEKCVLKAGTLNGTSSISCNDVQSALKYKSFVWESADNMIPIAVSELKK